MPQDSNFPSLISNKDEMKNKYKELCPVSLATLFERIKNPELQLELVKMTFPFKGQIDSALLANNLHYGEQFG